MTNEDISKLKARIIKKRLSHLPYNDREVNQCASDISWVIHELLSQGLLMVWNTDMDSAPRDGTLIIVSRPYYPGMVIPECGTDYWGTNYAGNGAWMKSNKYCQPTAWMPLPKGGE